MIRQRLPQQLCGAALKYKKILIVDDEADLREMVTSILEQDGFKTIKTAGTVAEALKICRDWEPDLAILDVMLPDGNGFSLFEQMRTFTEVPVLFLTARGEDEDKLKGLEGETSFSCLNDVVITRAGFSRIIGLNIYVNERCYRYGIGRSMLVVYSFCLVHDKISFL